MPEWCKGSHRGLKIPRLRDVPVRIRPRAPTLLIIFLLSTSDSQCRKTHRSNAPRSAPGVANGRPLFSYKGVSYEKNYRNFISVYLFIWK